MSGKNGRSAEDYFRKEKEHVARALQREQYDLLLYTVETERGITTGRGRGGMISCANLSAHA